jgi:ribosomal protein S6--L-glutamate ligase
VVLAETDNAARSVIQAFMGLNANIMVQEFIEEAGGSDIRCLVIGEKVVAAIKRQGKEGEFRSNLHRGGSASSIRLTPHERATAVQAAKIMGLNVCGVDLLRSNRGPLVMEVNSSPGLEGIEKTSGKDIAGLMIEYIEKAIDNKTRLKQ